MCSNYQNAEYMWFHTEIRCKCVKPVNDSLIAKQIKAISTSQSINLKSTIPVWRKNPHHKYKFANSLTLYVS